MENKISIRTEKTQLQVPDYVEPMNKYLLLHSCEDPKEKRQKSKIIVAGANPAQTFVVVAFSADCEMKWAIGDVVYLTAGNACPAFPVNLEGDIYWQVQEIYVPLRIRSEKSKEMNLEAVVIYAEQTPGILKATPEAAAAMSKAVQSVR